MRGQPYPIGLLMFMIASVLLHSCGGTEAYYDVVVVGGGAGGTSAGIQSARSGASVLIVEETPWLGGMLTSAGVSALTVTIVSAAACSASSATLWPDATGAMRP